MSSFWKKIGRLLWVNPEYSESMLTPGKYRVPAPGSQPAYSKAPTEVTKIHHNYYFNRDVRRNYPRTHTYTQEDLAKLLVAPKQESIASGETTPVAQITSLTEAVSQSPLVTSQKLPPTPPGVRYRFKGSSDAPTPPENTYFPMYYVN
ncbi:hypothetical protein K493DRAFT_318505 [Basidiobolus meristosporus CBS 931.73]|uniref:NADH dehydrogenase [ubiquinone] 1 alpha subcomplex subunit 7 n=1 Tax=Basidiobolus meristosporus CBS 931.73 TaxID=1314790 RepID=A0A1Y1XVE1_9FUNG|nr:hypothetical protein K493DRAFT_318505 [Basidiobolus meristosporus CBS 931.73]|eukprot:ORX89737.1 hypothetical protein K493DRAFT_318505 [Basidiobolus meristosporus CBS 931.73]